MISSSRILLVEDEPLNRVITSRLFKRLGVLIDTAESGEDAIKKLKEADYDLILMDVSMPGMGGLAASQYIRQNMAGRKKGVKIIAMTGYDSDSDMRRCLQAGMDDYISKPVDLVNLFQKLGLLEELPEVRRLVQR